MSIPPALAQTLAMLADAAAEAGDDWWIIGSTAVALHGAEVGCPKDVDLLMSVRDANVFLKRLSVEPVRGTGDGKFRSEVFGAWTEPPLPVEAFGGFALQSEGVWREVRLATRIAVPLANRRVYLPERDELVRLLQSFGRPKDLDRARLLGE